MRGAPDDVAVRLHRQALNLLRPELATIWLDAEPAERGWPAEVSAHALEVAARAAVSREQQPTGPVARRPGTRPETVILNPRDDQDFALALSLAPFSHAVEGMSRRGQLIFARRPGDAGLLLRLTDAEHAALRQAAPVERVLLVRTDPPGDRFPRQGWGRLLLVLFAGATVLDRAIRGIGHRSLGARVDVALGLGLVVLVAWWLVSAIRRRLRERRGWSLPDRSRRREGDLDAQTAIFSGLSHD